MKIDNYKLPKSSFLSVDKDLSIVSDWILKNQRIKKLLYYTTPDALSRVNLDEDQSLELFGKNVKIIPKITVDEEILNYIIISFDNFSTNRTNPEFRDNTITFDIICHFEQWQLDGGQLRPYRIAAEIDSIFDNVELTGLGKIKFVGAAQVVLNDKLAGLSLMYETIHGGEDKFNMENPAEQEEFVVDFNELFNSK